MRQILKTEHLEKMAAHNLLRLFRVVRKERIRIADAAFGNCGEPCHCHAIYDPDPQAREEWDALDAYCKDIKRVLESKEHVETKPRTGQGAFMPPRNLTGYRLKKWQGRQAMAATQRQRERRRGRSFWAL